MRVEEDSEGLDPCCHHSKMLSGTSPGLQILANTANSGWAEMAPVSAPISALKQLDFGQVTSPLNHLTTLKRRFHTLILPSKKLRLKGMRSSVQGHKVSVRVPTRHQHHVEKEIT